MSHRTRIFLAVLSALWTFAVGAYARALVLRGAVDPVSFMDYGPHVLVMALPLWFVTLSPARIQRAIGPLRILALLMVGLTATYAGFALAGALINWQPSEPSSIALAVLLGFEAISLVIVVLVCRLEFRLQPASGQDARAMK